MRSHIKLEVLGLSSAFSSSNNTYALILKEVDGMRRLPVIIGIFEAQAIAFELEKYKRQRPLTHDLFADTLKKLDCYIEKIVIDDIREGIFYATMFLVHQGRVIELDARPSDAVAMALRFNASIFAERKVLDEAGVFVKEEPDIEEDIEPMETESTPETYEDIEDRIQSLHSEIDQAILNEDYELAARLRDEIKRLESKRKK